MSNESLLSYRGSRVPVMPRGNPSPKLAITVDPEVHAGIIEAAEAEGLSISAWITRTARRELQIRKGLAAVDEWQAEHGEFTDEERAEARARVLEQLLGR